MTSFFNKRDAIRNKPDNKLLINKAIKEYLFTDNHTTFLELIKSTESPSFFEYISKDQPVNLFFDIEISKSKYPQQFKEHLDVVTAVKNVIEQYFQQFQKTYIVLESHSVTKKSYHIIIRMSHDDSEASVYFKNVEDMKIVVTNLQELQEYIQLGIVDTSVYREGLFRTIYSSKPGETRPLSRSELSDPFEDIETFVTYTKEPFALYTPNDQSGVKVEVASSSSSKRELKQLTAKAKTDIKKFVKEHYKHKPKEIRDINVDYEHNCIIVSMNETYCEFIEREHKSNHQYIVIDTHSSKQKCHDTDCEGKKFNETKVDKYPDYLLEVVKSVLEFDDKQFDLLQGGKNEAAEYIKTNFDERAALVDFDRNEEVFRSNVNNSNLVNLLRGQCKECQAAHEIARTGYCVKCLVCKSMFPATARIPNPEGLSNFFAQYTQLVNHGTINNNITIYNGSGEVEEGCDIPLDPEVFDDLALTSLVSDCLEDYKINQLANLLHHVHKEHIWTGDTWYYFTKSGWKNDRKGTELKRVIMQKVCEDIFKQHVKKYYDKKPQTLDTTKIQKTARYMIKKLNSSTFKEEIIKEGYQYYEDLSFIYKLNSKKHLVSFTNGVYDLMLKEFRPTKMDDYIELSTGYEHDSTIMNDEVITFIEQVLPVKAVRDYVLKRMSDCLNGDIPNTMFLMFIGDGANGKSQLLNLLKATMGDFGEKADVTLLTRKRSDANEANSEKAKLMNKRFAFFSEPDDGEKINIGLLKELTGSEEIVARELYQQSRSFVMDAKFFLACNELPSIKAEDTALWRRIRVVDFPSRFVDSPNESNEFKIDRTLPSKIREDLSWKQTFMNILVEYYHKDVAEPNEVKVKTNEYRDENNDFQNWLCENIERKEGSILHLKDICTLYLNKQKVHSKESSKLKKEVEKWIKEKYPGLKWEFSSHRNDDTIVRGWKNLQICNI